jgi:hypothetical protein
LFEVPRNSEWKWRAIALGEWPKVIEQSRFMREISIT